MTQINNWTDFQIPNRLNVETETLTERYGKFYAQPFERGFGTTIGNSLRRALLSSIEGAWQTAVGRGRPNWISAGGDDLTVTVSALPTRQDVDATINEQLIVELYSK